MREIKSVTCSKSRTATQFGSQLTRLKITYYSTSSSWGLCSTTSREPTKEIWSNLRSSFGTNIETSMKSMSRSWWPSTGPTIWFGCTIFTFYLYHISWREKFYSQTLASSVTLLSPAPIPSKPANSGMRFWRVWCAVRLLGSICSSIAGISLMQPEKYSMQTQSPWKVVILA